MFTGEAFPSRTDESGQRKPFEQFLQEVRAIDERYNKNYLRAEYNFATASAQMAAKWEQFEADGDRYNLQYRTAGDDKVRPAHQELNGVTLPPSDPFWDIFYPPNGFNCRCTVVQVRKSSYPATDSAEAMERGDAALEGGKGLFRFNPGKEKSIWPKYNPYTIRRCSDCDIATKSKLAGFIPESSVCENCKYLRTCHNHRLTSDFREHRNKMLSETPRPGDSKHDNLRTGILYTSSNSLRRAYDHAYTIEQAEVVKAYPDYVDNMEFSRRSELGEGKDATLPEVQKNIENKIKRGVTHYNVYEIEYQGISWTVKTEVIRGERESIYSIKKK